MLSLTKLAITYLADCMVAKLSDCAGEGRKTKVATGYPIRPYAQTLDASDSMTAKSGR